MITWNQISLLFLLSIESFNSIEEVSKRYLPFFRASPSILGWTTALWPEVTLFPWGRKVWPPCIKYLTGHRLQGEGEEKIVRFVLWLWAKYLIFLLPLSFRLLLFVDEADAFLRKRNQVSSHFVRWTQSSHRQLPALLCTRVNYVLRSHKKKLIRVRREVYAFCLWC